MLGKAPIAVKPVQRGALAVAVFLIGVAAFPTIVTLRNLRVSGDPVFIASQGGINLFLGNRPKADGFTPSTPTRYRFDGAYQDSVALYGQKAAEEAAGRPLTASEAQRYWVQRSLAWWRSDPSAALRLTFKKLTLAFSYQEIRNNTAFDFVKSQLAPFLRICFVGFWVAGPLGLLGIALGARRDRKVQFLAGFTLSYIASFIPFFMADRYRLPVVPLLLILSAYSVTWIVDNARIETRRRSSFAFAGLAAFTLFVNVTWYPTSTPATRALDYWSAGNRYVQMGRYTDAESWYRRALKIDKHNGDIWNGLGELLYYQQRPQEASAMFENARAAGQDAERVDYNEALCAEQTGDLRTARNLLRQAIAAEPSYTAARNELANLSRNPAASGG